MQKRNHDFLLLFRGFLLQQQYLVCTLSVQQGHQLIYQNWVPCASLSQIEGPDPPMGDVFPKLQCVLRKTLHVNLSLQEAAPWQVKVIGKECHGQFSLCLVQESLFSALQYRQSLLRCLTVARHGEIVPPPPPPTHTCRMGGNGGRNPTRHLIACK